MFSCCCKSPSHCALANVVQLALDCHYGQSDRRNEQREVQVLVHLLERSRGAICTHNP